MTRKPSAPAAPPSTYHQWANARTAPAARLVAFEKWLYAHLAETLVWPPSPAERKRQIGQCRALVMQAVADMGRHGYLFDPANLHAILTAKIDEIATLQRQGKVTNLYPYFRAVWRQYVGEKSEDLRDRAMHAGTHIQQLAQLTFERDATSPGPSICAIAEEARRETLREAAAKERQRLRRATADARQGRFL